MGMGLCLWRAALNDRDFLLGDGIQQTHRLRAAQRSTHRSHPPIARKRGDRDSAQVMAELVGLLRFELRTKGL
jgi:hypothetical protein